MTFPIDPFTQFVSNAPLANTPGTSDVVPLIQSGVTKKLPFGSFPGLTPIIVAPTKLFATGSSYSVLSTDYFLGVNLSPSAAFTFNLEGAPGVGHTIIIKDIAGTVTGATPITIAGGTIDGQSGWILPFAYSCLTIQAVGGTNWAIIQRLQG